MSMEAMLEISLYSYPYFSYQKYYVFIIIAYVYSSIKLKKGAEQVLPGSEGSGVREKGLSRELSEKWPKQCMHI
jgi:hypothetical protein